ncbi:MAG: hypothetical protein QM756_24990 [Polyangiaceae bacterium]
MLTSHAAWAPPGRGRAVEPVRPLETRVEHDLRHGDDIFEQRKPVPGIELDTGPVTPRPFDGVPVERAPIRSPEQLRAEAVATEKKKLEDEASKLARGATSLGQTVQVLSRLANRGEAYFGFGDETRSKRAALKEQAIEQAKRLVPTELSTSGLKRAFSDDAMLEGVERTEDEVLFYRNDGTGRVVLRIPLKESALKARQFTFGDFSGLRVEAWDQARHDYRRRTENAMKRLGSDALPLFTIDTTQKAPSLTFHDGQTVGVTEAEWKSLRAGTPLPPDHPLSKRLTDGSLLLLYAAPLQLRIGSPLTTRVDEDLFALQKSYPRATVVRDPLSDQTVKRMAELRNLTQKQPEAITAVVADKSFSLRDGKLVQNIADELTLRGVEVLKHRRGSPAASSDPEKRRLVITISGHTSQPLSELVASLGHSGLLKDNIVVFMACESKLTRELQTEIIEKHGAAGLLAFQGEIKVSQLQPILLDVAKQFEASKSKDCLDALEPVGNTAHEGSPPTPDINSGFIQRLRDAMRLQGLNGFWVVSTSEKPTNESAFDSARDILSVALPPVGNERRPLSHVEFHRVAECG